MRLVIALAAIVLSACTSGIDSQEQACLSAYEGGDAEFAEFSRTGATLGDLCGCYSSELAKLGADPQTEINNVMLLISDLRQTNEMDFNHSDKHLVSLIASNPEDPVLNKRTLGQYESFMRGVHQVAETGGACRTIEKSKLHMMCDDLMSDDVEQQEWLAENDTFQLELCGCYSKITDGRTQSFRDHQAKFITEILRRKRDDGLSTDEAMESVFKDVDTEGSMFDWPENFDENEPNISLITDVMGELKRKQGACYQRSS